MGIVLFCAWMAFCWCWLDGTAYAEQNDVLIALRVAKQESLTAEETKLLLALRAAENGGPGREYGVLSIPAPTQEQQARIAARSIKANKRRWEAAGGPVDFVSFMGSRWAPVGAENDPHSLNRHWEQNVKAFLEVMQ